MIKHSFTKRLRRAAGAIFAAAALIFAAGLAARAESAYAVNLGGAAAGTDSAAKGFGAVVVNDAETRAIVYLRFAGLSGAPDFVSGVRMIDENGAPLRFVPLNAQAVTQTFAFTPSAAEIAQMKRGRVAIEVRTANYPNGEIAGRVAPYPAFVARLRPENTNPPGDPNGDGFALVVLNADETDGVLYYRYAGLAQAPALIGLDLAVIESPGGGQFSERMWFLSQKLTVDAAFRDRLKRGRQALRLSADLATQLQGTLRAADRQTDFNGDARADLAVFRAAAGAWYWQNSLNGRIDSFQFGSAASRPVPADFDGDGRTDYAVWLPSNGTFYVWNVFDDTFRAAQWGKSGDVPLPADYDGDGKADFAVYRPGAAGAQSVFWIAKSTGGFYAVPFGLGEDRPLVGDFDGDRRSDPVVWRPSNGTFYALLSATGEVAIRRWGVATDRPFVADFDGDAAADFAVYRTSGAEAGNWYVSTYAGATSVFRWGAAADEPVPADYDGDGKADHAVFRAGTWFVAGSAGQIRYHYFGAAGDAPVSAR